MSGRTQREPFAVTDSMPPTPEEFKTFLCEKLGLSIEEVPAAGPWTGTGNTIGAVALRSGLLDLPKIERVLERQERTRELFGQAAVALGHLSQPQVERLLALQRLQAILEVGERLVLVGRLDLRRLAVLLAEFVEPSKASESGGQAMIS